MIISSLHEVVKEVFAS